MRYLIKPGLTSNTFDVFDDRTNTKIATFYDMISAYDYATYKQKIADVVNRVMIEIEKDVNYEVLGE